MAVQIKLCGFKNIEDIIFASSLNIDYLGMIFVKDMPRTIDTKTAIRAVSICKDNGIKSVGVFLNQSKDVWVNFKKQKSLISERDILKKIEFRNKARKNKDYTEADKIRNELLDKGVLIEDKDGKTSWKIK